MSISQQIAKAIWRLRSLPDIDIERLSYELSETEWHAFAKELDGVSLTPSHLDITYADRCIFMGMTIRKRSDQVT